MPKLRGCLSLAVAAALMGPVGASQAEPDNPRERAKPGEDTSGRPRQGEASYYHQSLHGRPMANGERFDNNSNSAASRTLPLGTVAEVENLETGKSAKVEIEDRGPYARNRTIDLSRRTAREIGIGEEGTAPVRITPLQVPRQDGTLRSTGHER